MTTSWITLYPRWYVQERNLLACHYPNLAVDEARLRDGTLVLYGELTVRPPGGGCRHPIAMCYPQATPFEPPQIVLLDAVPERDDGGAPMCAPRPRLVDHRHQMPAGNLCLFQRETRMVEDSGPLRGVEVLRRAEQYLMGIHTGHWPPDSAEAELESHFVRVAEALAPSMLFRDGLDGWGRLGLVQDQRRPAQSMTCPLAPFLVTALTEESRGVVRSLDARDELVQAYPWLADDAWDATRLARATHDDPASGVRFRRGYWWSLPTEPLPFHDGGGLIRSLSSAAPDRDWWALLSAALKGELSTEAVHFIGLRFPARHEGYDWLMVCVHRGDRPVGSGVVLQTEAQKRTTFESAPVYVAGLNRLDPPTLQLRNTGVVAPDTREKTVALIGLGALGSVVAELLAKAGVGHFQLCDHDRLHTGNVVRHVGGIGDFGALKTEVVTKRLLQINPCLTFRSGDIVSDSAVGSLDRLSTFIASADLTICTTADESVESVVNQIAVISGSPVLYGRSMRRASMGRVFLVRPGKDACKACLGGYLQDGRGSGTAPGDWIDIREDDEDVLLHECGRPVIAGSAIDLSFIAALIARVALDFLEGRSTSCNHWVWSQSPAQDVDCRLDAPLSTFRGELPPRSDCQACRSPEVTSLVLTQEAREVITRETEASTDAETGGVLIGYVDDEGSAMALRATGPGPKAIRSRTEFRKDVEYTQAELDRAAGELGERGLYIGEWHSHLVPQPTPSPMDVDSLFGISGAPNYPTRCPVLVITGLDEAAAQMASLGSWVYPVDRPACPIPNRPAQQVGGHATDATSVPSSRPPRTKRTRKRT